MRKLLIIVVCCHASQSALAAEPPTKGATTPLSIKEARVVPLNLVCHTRKGEPDAKREIAVNPAEFLYALAQQYRALATRGKPNDVVLVSKKVTPEQVCKLLLPQGGNRFEGSTYRGYLTREELDAAWTRTEPASRRR
jgi:hypothetical protein